MGVLHSHHLALPSAFASCEAHHKESAQAKQAFAISASINQ